MLGRELMIGIGRSGIREGFGVDGDFGFLVVGSCRWVIYSGFSGSVSLSSASNM